jgi:hypothetical protein
LLVCAVLVVEERLQAATSKTLIPIRDTVFIEDSSYEQVKGAAPERALARC